MLSIMNSVGKQLCKVEPTAHLVEIVRKRERTLIVLVDDGTVIITTTFL
jgi:hypothetical protein